MMAWLRESKAAAWVLTVLRLWLGYEWISGGLEKVGNASWTGDKAGGAIVGFIKGALGKTAGDHAEVHAWFGDFLSNFVSPNVKAFSYVVSWGELLVGLGLILGCFTLFAGLMGVLMNLMYLWAGTSSTNPEMLVVAAFLLCAGANSSVIGLDRFVMPWVKGLFSKNSSGDLPFRS